MQALVDHLIIDPSQRAAYGDITPPLPGDGGGRADILRYLDGQSHLLPKRLGGPEEAEQGTRDRWGGGAGGYTKRGLLVGARV